MRADTEGVPTADPPGTSELWLGDVGSAYDEEIDRLLDPTAAPKDVGWPCYEGDVRQPIFKSLGTNMCEGLYAAGTGAVSMPYFKYHHTDPVAPTGDTCPTGGSSTTGVAFYNGGSYPSSYVGALFMADFARKCIWVMPKGANGLPDRPWQRSSSGTPLRRSSWSSAPAATCSTRTSTGTASPRAARSTG